MSPPVKPEVQTSVTSAQRRRRLCAGLRLGARITPSQAFGGQVQVAAQEGGGGSGGGAAGCAPVGAELGA